MVREIIEVTLKIEMEQRPPDGYSRNHIWWSRLVMAPYLSDWQGPFESEPKAAGYWRDKLVALANGR